MKFLSALVSAFISTALTAIAAILLLVLILSPGPCEHENTKDFYSFQFKGSTATHCIQSYCFDCDKPIKSANFRGTPDDTSYLKAIQTQSNGQTLIAGEYYTVTATVSLSNHTINATRINCRAENEAFIVGYSVEFREEFEEDVKLLKKGDEITFYGKFYEDGCGFEDCIFL